VEKDFLEQIAKLLREGGYSFEREPLIGGLRPDFLVTGPNGQIIIVEAKPWAPVGGNTARAMEQVKLYQTATGANSAILVMPDLKKNRASDGVVNTEGLLPHLRELIEAPARKPKVERQSADRIAFAAMPFSGKYDDTYFVAMTESAKNNNATCIRVDHTEYSGDVVKKIKKLISDSRVVIADISGSRPNVLFEAGFAEALGRPVIYISSSPLDEAPFDIRNEPIISYQIGQTKRLLPKLTTRLRAVLS
jgi:hypothetical protein